MGHANQSNYAIFDPLTSVPTTSVIIFIKIKQMTLKTNKVVHHILSFEGAYNTLYHHIKSTIHCIITLI
jgi:hypothetical protein